MKLIGENQSTRGETCPSATLSTTNPTWTDPGIEPGFRGERPATNRLSHAPGSIRTYYPSKRATADPRLIPRGHWDRLMRIIVKQFYTLSGQTIFFLLQEVVYIAAAVLEILKLVTMVDDGTQFLTQQFKIPEETVLRFLFFVCYLYGFL